MGEADLAEPPLLQRDASGERGRAGVVPRELLLALASGQTRSAGIIQDYTVTEPVRQILSWFRLNTPMGGSRTPARRTNAGSS